MLISYRSPIVLTFMCRSFTIRIPTITAIRDPGIVLLIYGHTIRIARQTSPTTSACQLIVDIFLAIASTFSIVSIVTVPSGYVSPKKSLTCPMTIVTAIPAVNPVVIVNGIYLIRLPNLRSPITTRIIPARIVARIRPSIPFCATIPATIVANAAVGPAICTRLPPKNEIRNPAMIAV